MTTDNKPKRTYRRKVTIAVVAVGALLVGAVAGNLGWTLIDYFIQNPEVEKTPDIVEIAGQPEFSELAPTELRNAPQAHIDNQQDSNQPENSPRGLLRHVDPKIQSGLRDLEDQLQHLYAQMGSLSRKLDSYKEAAGIEGKRFTYSQRDLRELQSALRKLQESVKANYQSIRRITDSGYGREFVTLAQVQSLIGSIPKVGDREIRNVVERTLRDHRLTEPGAYGTIERSVNDIRKDIDRIDQSMRDMRRNIDDLKRKIE